MSAPRLPDKTKQSKARGAHVEVGWRRLKRKKPGGKVQRLPPERSSDLLTARGGFADGSFGWPMKGRKKRGGITEDNWVTKGPSNAVMEEPGGGAE